MLVRRRGRLGHYGALSLGQQVAALFANGEKGAWLVPSPTTVFTDAGLTTPATSGAASGTLYLKDESGNGNHATLLNAVFDQDADGRYRIVANGTDTSGTTAAIDFTGTNKMTLCAAIRKLSDAAAGFVLELSANATTNDGSFALLAPRNGTGADISTIARGTSYVQITSPAAAVNSYVASANISIAGPVFNQRVNGGTSASSASTLGTGNFGSHVLHLFNRSGGVSRFNGHFFGTIIRGATSTSAEVSMMERYFAGKSGVTLA